MTNTNNSLYESSDKNRWGKVSGFWEVFMKRAQKFMEVHGQRIHRHSQLLNNNATISHYLRPANERRRYKVTPSLIG